MNRMTAQFAKIRTQSQLGLYKQPLGQSTDEHVKPHLCRAYEYSTPIACSLEVFKPGYSLFECSVMLKLLHHLVELRDRHLVELLSFLHM